MSISPEIVKKTLLEETSRLISRSETSHGQTTTYAASNNEYLVEDTVAILGKEKSGGFVLKLFYIKFVSSESMMGTKKGSKQDRDTNMISLDVFNQKTVGLVSFLGDGFLWDKTKEHLFNLNLLSDGSSTSGVNKRHHIVSKGRSQKTKTMFQNVSSAFPDYFQNDSGILSSWDPYSSNWRDYGKKRGSLIHKEIEDFVKYGPIVFEKIHNNPEPMTQYIMDALSKAGYLGLCAEYPIWFPVPDRNAKKGATFLEKTKFILASAIDLICWDTVNKRIVLLEIKTGYDHGQFYHRYLSQDEYLLAKTTLNEQKSLHQLGFVNTNQNVFKPVEGSKKIFVRKNSPPFLRSSPLLPKLGSMLGSLSGMKDCPVTRAKIQLCMYLYYFRSELKIECIGQVLHCQSDGTVEFINVEDGWYNKYTNIILKELQRI